MALRKQILDAQHRLVELEPVWEVFIAKHNDKEEAREQKQRRKAAVAALPSEEDASSDRSDPRLSTSDPSTSAAIDTRHLATPRGADDVRSCVRDPGSASTLEMFLPESMSLESGRALGPSSATVDFDAARDTKNNRGSSAKHVKDAHQDDTGSSSSTNLRQVELIRCLLIDCDIFSSFFLSTSVQISNIGFGLSQVRCFGNSD